MDLYPLFVDLSKKTGWLYLLNPYHAPMAAKKMFKTNSLLYMTVYGPKCSYVNGASQDSRVKSQVSSSARSGRRYKIQDSRCQIHAKLVAPMVAVLGRSRCVLRDFL